MVYETRRAVNDGGGEDLAAATGLLGKQKQAKVRLAAAERWRRDGLLRVAAD
jgi:hypothetical protein